MEIALQKVRNCIQKRMSIQHGRNRRILQNVNPLESWQTIFSKNIQITNQASDRLRNAGLFFFSIWTQKRLSKIKPVVSVVTPCPARLYARCWLPATWCHCISDISTYACPTGINLILSSNAHHSSRTVISDSWHDSSCLADLKLKTFNFCH